MLYVNVVIKTMACSCGFLMTSVCHKIYSPSSTLLQFIPFLAVLPFSAL